MFPGSSFSSVRVVLFLCPALGKLHWAICLFPLDILLKKWLMIGYYNLQE